MIRPDQQEVLTAARETLQFVEAEVVQTLAIRVEVTSRYGRRDVLPLCEAGKAFAKIAGTKTLTDDTIKQIKTLGYAIEIQQKELTL